MADTARPGAETKMVVTPDGRNLAYIEVGDPDGPLVIHNHGGPDSRLEARLFADFGQKAARGHSPRPPTSIRLDCATSATSRAHATELSEKTGLHSTSARSTHSAVGSPC